ncbi:MAG: flagellar basal body-associated FliL family protein [Rhodospirillales bacterium]|nr:flagellar basal body-associated FliL family protein [Rhodospirillales bacterium]
MARAKADRTQEPEGGAAEGKDGGRAKAGGRRRIVLLALPALLALGIGALWFSGTLPRVLGLGTKTASPAAAAAAPPVFVALPPMIANLNAGPDRQSFVKLAAKLEVPTPADAKRAELAMPRIVDLFQTYLREMRPQDFQGSAGTWRLREALLSRAAIALAPGRVRDVLFTEILVQ